MKRSVVAVVLLTLSFLAALPAAPVQAQCGPGVVHCLPPPYSVGAAPVWGTLTGVAGGNYPGGNQTFNIFFLVSDYPPLGNVSLLSEALTTPFQNFTVGGLPLNLSSGQSLSTNVTLHIPSDFAQSNFTANLAIHFHIANATAASFTLLTTSATVFMLGSPIGVAPGAVSSTTGAPSAPQPVWVTLHPLAYGNYPGGNEQFAVFVANSASPPLDNVSLFNETLTSPSLPAGQNSGFALGLPVLLAKGQGILSTIYLPIPANFGQKDFTATLVVDLEISNGTGFVPEQVTRSVTVPLLNLPGVTSPPGGSTTTSETSSSLTTSSQGGGGASSLLYAAVAVIVVVVVVLVALSARRRKSPG